MLTIEITHDKQAGYGVDVVSDRNVRHNHGLVWTHNHRVVIDMVEEVLQDYRNE